MDAVGETSWPKKIQKELKPVRSKQSVVGNSPACGGLRICSATDQPCDLQASSSYYSPGP